MIGVLTRPELQQMARKLETQAIRYFDCKPKNKPLMQVVFTFPGEVEPWWIGNMDRGQSIGWLREAAEDIEQTPEGQIVNPGGIDLQPLCEQFERVMGKRLCGRPGLVLLFSLAPDYNFCHWVTNVDNESAARYLREAALKISAQLN